MPFSFRKFSFDPQATLPYPLEAVSDDPANPITLHIRYGGNGNPGFMSAIMKRDADITAKFGAKDSVAKWDALRTADVAIYADHIIVGWDNVLEDGKPVDCEPATVRRFLEALIQAPPDGVPEVFDRLRAFARTSEHFNVARPSDALGKR